MRALRQAGIKSMVTAHVTMPDSPSGGTDVFIGDHMVGWIRIKNFGDDELPGLALWLHQEAGKHFAARYPAK